MAKVEALYFWIGVSPEGEEGLLGYTDQEGTPLPLLCSGEEVLPNLRKLAVAAAMLGKCKARLIKVSGREDIEEIDGAALAAAEREAFKQRREESTH